ncbi:hypothetical protein J5N97_008859 [Dioscorea zingiberensis]|uniref:Uncharacterized protein n=1 Tax=Dioscorea zingiberensis TaxID=325984 RepID=A0A9D5CWY1_9LILI|nr:hypothetical protein J5N97_008859 [Dioscorea zingiberensis]
MKAMAEFSFVWIHDVLIVFSISFSMTLSVTASTFPDSVKDSLASSSCMTRYYNLPIYWPPKCIKDSTENLELENSPCRFKMVTNKSDVLLCCIEPLYVDTLSLLKKCIDKM